MERQIELPIQIQTETPQIGFQSSSSPPPSHPVPSQSSDPDQTAQDIDNCLHQELQNQIDLKEEFRNLNDSHEEEEEEEEFKSEESDKKSEKIDENDNESSEKEGDNLEMKNESNGDADNNRMHHQYPVRPEADDCAFYMKTGTCKFGVNCKFNHPVRRKNQAVNEKVKEREEATEMPGQTECKYYLRTGGCKYGKACRFNHTGEFLFSVPPLKTPLSPILELNFLGLPIRPGEKQCEYYMRNGSCKYGGNCKYNHPDPMAAGGSDPTTAFVNGGSASLPAPSPSSVGSWSSPRGLNDPTSFVPFLFSPNQGVPSYSSEWNGYQGPVYPPERSLHRPPSYAMSNSATENNLYAPQQQQTVVDEFPERPGQQLCSYFMKFGDCKFKSNCKFHHPKNLIPKSPSLTLNDKGLPLRPDQNVCSHYSRYGICKFGPACKFDHSIQPPLSGSGDNQDTALGNSVTQEEARMTESGNGSDTSAEQPV
ncbi:TRANSCRIPTION FACTOR C3H FAMILY-RELATED [Salix purpurea]|uniref:TRANSCRIPTION FACTOR C3H FAMILY-RELATED n=1 Tax=Salix purpurea TaxID=77065 RepID=A0A9Q0W5M7_SALPP|nr:zinc finger CCCH domain-containing protein [Salix suchowensis]KAJ6760839.1 TRANSCRIPTION FACTOR C3H FAMILY-RELATED [Salix purpurea]